MRKIADPNQDQKRYATTINGQEIETGQEVRVVGLHGTFVFQYEWIPDGSFACWDTKRHRMRAFRPASIQIVKKHKPKREK